MYHLHQPRLQLQGGFATDNCLYYDFYEAKNGYHLYRLDFELGKSYYDFSLYLFEKATEKLPYIASALHTMLTQNGLGKERVKAEAYCLLLIGKSALNEGKITLPETTLISYEPPPSVASDLAIRFITPLRIKHNNRFVRNAEHLDRETLSTHSINASGC